MSQLSDWFTVNRLNLNLDKTCYSTFHTNCVDLNKFKLYNTWMEKKFSVGGTGIRRLMRGMATLPQGNQELLVVKDKVGRPQVSLW